jgi:lipid-A-disaccharide synthase
VKTRNGPLRIGLVAGEASGDLLGAALIEALRLRVPDATFVGLAGERMRAAGCVALGSAEEIAVMGFVEPLRHLPRLLRLRSRLRREFLQRRVDVFIGIDSPAFNLGLAGALHRAGIVTIQYVSPQLWAWRPGRVRKIAAAVDAVLCLLPFEPAFYANHSVYAQFVGHPLADQVPLDVDHGAARRTLGVAENARVVALLPGSRVAEVRRLGADFAAAAALLAAQTGRATGDPPLEFLAPMASQQLAQIFARQVREAGAVVRLVDRSADTVLAAADAALVASGTATLQTLLYGCPMVVAYRVAPLTALLAREMGLVKVKHVSQPNLLAGEELVPEFLQEAVTPPALAAALKVALEDTGRRTLLQQRFRSIHLQLRQGGAAKAAQCILDQVAARAHS